MARDALEVQSYMYMYMHAVETFKWFVVKFRCIALSLWCLEPLILEL